MNTLAQRVHWLAGCPCRSRQAQASTPPPPQDLFQRYAGAEEHERLCLWLQHREARPDLELIEAASPVRSATLRRRLHRLLGIPLVG